MSSLSKPSVFSLENFDTLIFILQGYSSQSLIVSLYTLFRANRDNGNVVNALYDSLHDPDLLSSILNLLTMCHIDITYLICWL